MVIFGFDSVQELYELKNTNQNECEYIQDHDRKTGILMPPELWKYVYRDISKCNKKIAIAYNRYEGDHSFSWHKTWPTYFQGGTLIISDTNDKPFYIPPLVQYCEENNGLYFKSNLNKKSIDFYDEWRKKKHRQDWPKVFDMTERVYHKSLFANPYTPPAQSIRMVMDKGLTWKEWKDREYDVFWSGKRWSDMPDGRSNSIDKLKAACKKLGLKALIIDDTAKYLKRPQFLEAMNNSKIAYSFSKGPCVRSRRDWETLLCGALMIMDSKMKDLEITIMEPGQHFVWEWEDDYERQLEFLLKLSPEYSEILSFLGWKLAQDCFCSFPSVEFRVMMQTYLHRKSITTIGDLKDLEKIFYETTEQG